jgi:hypothetical protein
MTLAAIANLAWLVLSALAAIAWVRSATVRVPGPLRINGLPLTANINEVVFALQRSAKYNQLAAWLTAASVVSSIAPYFVSR